MVVQFTHMVVLFDEGRVLRKGPRPGVVHTTNGASDRTYDHQSLGPYIRPTSTGASARDGRHTIILEHKGKPLTATFPSF